MQGRPKLSVKEVTRRSLTDKEWRETRQMRVRRRHLHRNRLRVTTSPIPHLHTATESNAVDGNATSAAEEPLWTEADPTVSTGKGEDARNEPLPNGPGPNLSPPETPSRNVIKVPEQDGQHPPIEDISGGHIDAFEQGVKVAPTEGQEEQHTAAGTPAEIPSVREDLQLSQEVHRETSPAREPGDDGTQLAHAPTDGHDADPKNEKPDDEPGEKKKKRRTRRAGQRVGSRVDRAMQEQRAKVDSKNLANQQQEAVADEIGSGLKDVEPAHSPTTLNIGESRPGVDDGKPIKDKPASDNRPSGHAADDGTPKAKVKRPDKRARQAAKAREEAVKQIAAAATTIIDPTSAVPQGEKNTPVLHLAGAKVKRNADAHRDKRGQEPHREEIENVVEVSKEHPRERVEIEPSEERDAKATGISDGGDDNTLGERSALEPSDHTTRSDGTSQEIGDEGRAGAEEPKGTGVDHGLKPGPTEVENVPGQPEQPQARDSSARQDGVGEQDSDDDEEKAGAKKAARKRKRRGANKSEAQKAKNKMKFEEKLAKKYPKNVLADIAENAGGNQSWVGENDDGRSRSSVEEPRGDDISITGLEPRTGDRVV
ncbi:hypothetical protein BU23DRAFT_218574 [Bimuria novae-zelandiae CBS 107.79]|uniref:Uncharacterized protein n=1 Tax=Bimuria novae-zelandiae CBS 107.79 TaxID=1447943 RepID=A0A6A5UZ06_9PLEO|nr:hypothetical protein BU23DRAFT_218574 [Bimuria novae-zelandiae CBS 107.79]